MNINTITNSLIDKIILELNNHETKKKISDKCIKPFLDDLNEVTQKYFITIIILYGIVVLLLLLILFFILFRKNNLPITN
jgi:hypothetical protein